EGRAAIARPLSVEHRLRCRSVRILKPTAPQGAFFICAQTKGNLMNLKSIREAKANKTAEARTILAKAEGENRNLTAEEAAKVDGQKAEIEALESKEARQQSHEQTEQRLSGTVVAGERGNDLEQLESRVSLQRILQAGMEGRALDGAEAEYNREMERRNGRKAQGFYVPMSLLETRVNTTTSAADLVGTDHR